MRIKLAYGKNGLNLELPDRLNAAVLEPTYVKGLPDPVSAVREALRNPIGSAPLKSLVKPGDKVGIVFSDITRPVPNRLLLPLLLEELAGLPAERLVLFNATGTHRQNTEPELREMLGDEIVDRCRIVQNDATDRQSHVLVGRSSQGNDIWLLEEYVRCEVKILTGFIEPHFFAGFSAGGKAAMPGLGLLETIIRNHSAEKMDNPLARWGIAEGNPVWEEVREAARMAPPSFLLNVTLNRDKQITGVFAGNWEKAHERGREFVRGQAMVPVREKFDIVISTNSGYPLDLNLYQSVKGMSAAANVVREGGGIIMAADCWDGIPEHGEYWNMLLEAGDIETLLKTIRTPGFERQDQWEAQIQALICRKAEVYFYSDNLTDSQIESALLKPCRGIEATLEELLGKYGPQARVCVLPEGPQTIPYLAG